MSIPAAPVVVAGRHQRSRENIGKALPPLVIHYDDCSPNNQAADVDVDIQLDTPPLDWDSDLTNNNTPTYVKFILEDSDSDSNPAFETTVTEDDDGALIIEIPPVNPFSQPPQRRPFDYSPFSDSTFPFNFAPYRDESLVEGSRISEDNDKERSFGSEIVTITLVSGASVADSETDVFPISLDDPLTFDLLVEGDHKLDPQLTYDWAMY